MIDLPHPHHPVYVYDDPYYGGTVIASQWLVDDENEQPVILVLALMHYPPHYRLMVLTYVVDHPVVTYGYSEDDDGGSTFEKYRSYTGWLLKGSEPRSFMNIVQAADAYENF